jgi:hypothetical protein
MSADEQHDATASPAYQAAELAAWEIVKVAATKPDYLLNIAMERMDVLQRHYGATPGAHFLIAALGEVAAKFAAVQFQTPRDIDPAADPHAMSPEEAKEYYAPPPVDTDAMGEFLDTLYMRALARQARKPGGFAIERWVQEAEEDPDAWPPTA